MKVTLRIESYPHARINVANDEKGIGFNNVAITYGMNIFFKTIGRDFELTLSDEFNEDAIWVAARLQNVKMIDDAIIFESAQFERGVDACLDGFRQVTGLTFDECFELTYKRLYLNIKKLS